MSPAVRIERDTDGPVARLVLADGRPGNPVTTATIDALREGLRQLEADDGVKVIVIAADGADLTCGFDPAQAEQVLRDAPGGNVRKVPSQRARFAVQDRLWWGPDGLYTRLLHCPKVTLLAARGRCLDVGLYLALCCDLVVADDTASFGSPRWRHVGVDGDVSLLVAAVGLKRAKDLLAFSARWDASQAMACGLVDEVVPTADLDGRIRSLSAWCSQVMRDGIAGEKHVVFASLAKLQVPAGFATAAAVGAWATNLHFRPGEFNFLREVRDHGLEAAVAAARAHSG